MVTVAKVQLLRRQAHFFYLSRRRLSFIEAGVFFAIKQKVESCKDNPGMIY